MTAGILNLLYHKNYHKHPDNSGTITVWLHSGSKTMWLGLGANQITQLCLLKRWWFGFNDTQTV